MKKDYQIQSVLESYMKSHGGRLSHAAKHFNVTTHTIKKYCRQFGIPFDSNPGRRSLDLLREDSRDTKDYTDFFRLRGDTLVASDFHIPFFSLDWVEKAIAVSESHRIRQICVAGDFFDGKTVSKYRDGARQHTLQYEMRVARDMFYDFLDRFKDIYFITGNHDARLPKYMDFEFSLDFFFDIVAPDEKIHVSDYAYCIHEGTEGIDTRITHPLNFSKVKGTVASELADIKMQHILMGHTHHICDTFSKSGQFRACEIGGLFDKEKTEYYMKLDRRNPEWDNGFAMIRDSKITLFHKGTDWDILL